MIHASNDSWFTGLRRHRRFYVALLACVVALACLKPAALLAIEGYQRLVSPYKGYHCAYGVLYGTSCSQFGERAISEYGLLGGLILLRQQFRGCHEAAIRIRSGACQVPGARADESDECFESSHNRGKREANETKEYCAGCLEGLCGG